jgi:hypothetical protein
MRHGRCLMPKQLRAGVLEQQFDSYSPVPVVVAKMVSAIRAAAHVPYAPKSSPIMQSLTRRPSSSAKSSSRCSKAFEVWRSKRKR